MDAWLPRWHPRHGRVQAAHQRAEPDGPRPRRRGRPAQRRRGDAFGRRQRRAIGGRGGVPAARLLHRRAARHPERSRAAVAVTADSDADADAGARVAAGGGWDGVLAALPLARGGRAERGPRPAPAAVQPGARRHRGAARCAARPQVHTVPQRDRGARAAAASPVALRLPWGAAAGWLRNHGVGAPRLPRRRPRHRLQGHGCAGAAQPGLLRRALPRRLRLSHRQAAQTRLPSSMRRHTCDQHAARVAAPRRG
mmetsp:Transcript_18235/g.43345  ORF Transcript_18235/g.43345 Transcript_18235/m.43345 type:complete len:253 (-) Transcript_18235:18-776(-)